MLLSILLCTALLLSISHSANVLVVAGHRGSHLYVSTDIADKLVGFGHNVTVVTMFSDDRVHIEDRDFRFIAFGRANDTRLYFKHWDAAFKHFMHRPSRDMLSDSLISQANVEKVKLWRNDFNTLALRYFQGDEFALLLDTAKIDLIVLENSIAIPAMTSLVHRNIPVLGIVCYPGARDVNDRFGPLGYMNGVASWANNVKNSPPTFVERWQTLVTMSRFFAAFVPSIQSLVDKTSKPRANIEEYFTAIYDVVFINDHPAFSFPFLSPPNTFYLGLFTLEDRPLKPLPQDYQEFLANCPHKHTALVSFGSYLQDITTFSGTPTILKTLRKMDVCVIVKSEVDLSVKFDLPAEKFLHRSWIPQKDLLGSGRLDFFISHCGNNGRMEAIYYNVPVLCIPLFGDQYYNGRLVEC